jgi:L-threonylcarbamoyladenylate synthase
MSEWMLRRAARIVQDGGVIAYPTESIYGLGCSPYDGLAVLRILQIKQRDPSQGLILIGRSLNDFIDFILPLDKTTEERVMSTWPGPYTWLLPASESCPPWLRGKHHSIAVRVTAHPLCRKLCRHSGMALVSTSANQHGYPPAKNVLQVRQRLGDQLDFILSGPTSGLDKPSEIRDAITGRKIR